MRRILLVAFLFAVASSHPQKASVGKQTIGGNPPNPPVNSNNQIPDTDKRGTDNLPLIVHADNRPRSQQETEWDQRNADIETAQRRIQTRLTIGIAVTGGLQAILLGFQLIILGKQVKQTITSERAWLICRVDNLGIPSIAEMVPFGIRFHIENVGKTPGFILEYGWKIEDILREESLPEVPTDYKDSGSDFAIHDRLAISPQAGITRSGDGVSTDARVLHAGIRVVWVHGYVRYQDSFSRTIHETRTCYKWLPKRANSGAFEFAIAGPSAYNKAT